MYSFSPTKTFELPLYKGEAAPPVVFDKVGAVKIGCNIHDWMSGIILVLPSRYFAVTDSLGHFVLENLPAGTYTLVAWHALSKLEARRNRTVHPGRRRGHEPDLQAAAGPAQTSARDARKPGGAMRWWNSRSLRARIFVTFSALIIAVLLATLGLTQLVVGRDTGRTLSRELRTTGQVFESLLRERAVRLQTNSTLLASDFALKRVFATHFDPGSYDSETLASAGLSYRQRIGVQLVWMTDEQGTLLAASPGEGRIGQSLASFAPLKEAIESQAAATAVVEVDNELFQMVAVPVLGPDVIGFLMLGQIIDDRVAARLKDDTHSDVTFLTDSQVFASSWPTKCPRARSIRIESHCFSP